MWPRGGPRSEPRSRRAGPGTARWARGDGDAGGFPGRAGAPSARATRVSAWSPGPASPRAAVTVPGSGRGAAGSQGSQGREGSRSRLLPAPHAGNAGGAHRLLSHLHNMAGGGPSERERRLREPRDRPLGARLKHLGGARPEARSFKRRAREAAPPSSGSGRRVRAAGPRP